jgi:glucosamine-6-phosphate deaminase
MDFIKVKNEKELGVTAAKLVCDSLGKKDKNTIIFPTGNTPLGMFNELVALHRSGKMSFKGLTLFELDEYFAIEKDDDRNLFAWLDRELISQVDFQTENIYRFDSFTSDPQGEIRRMTGALQMKGGIDLLVLGLGMNGHLGFNEPGTQVNSPTRLINLTRESIISSTNYWGAGVEIPRQGFTFGMDVLLKARKIILLVQGKSKAQILGKMMNGIITDQIPASYLRLVNDLTIIADQDAATLIDI